MNASPFDPSASSEFAASWEQVREAAFQALKNEEPDRAEALLLHAVQDAEAPGIEPAWLIKALDELARLYHRLYRHDKIEATLTRLLAVQEATLGDQHPELSGTLQALAWEIGKCGQPERAEALYRRALAIDEAVYGPDHLYVAGSLRVLGVRLYFSRRYEEAVALLERARSISEASQDRGALSELDAALGCLELAYTGWERYTDAERVLLRHLELAEQRREDGLQVGGLLEKLGHARQARRKFAEADEAYLNAIQRYGRWFESLRRAKRFRGGPPSRWSTSVLRASRHERHGRLLYSRSLALGGLGRDAEAQHCLVQAERALRLARSINEPLGRNRGLASYEPAMAFAAVLRARGKNAEADTLEAQATSDWQTDGATAKAAHHSHE